MESKVARYAKYKRDIKCLIVASGIWPHYEKHPHVLRKLLSFCSAFCSGSTFYCIVAFCFKYATNINIFTSCLGLMIGFFTTFIKIVILSMRQEDLQSLNEGVSKSFENNLKLPENQPHLLYHFPSFSRFFYLYAYVVGISFVFLASTPLSIMLRYGKYVRMYPQLMPFAYEPGGSVHWAVFGFEMFTGFYLWSVTIGVDSIFGLYALHMVGQLRLLGSRFQNLKSSSNYDKELGECVRSHIQLMKSRHKLQRVFGFLAIWLAVTCAIALCSQVFQALHMRNTTPVRALYLFGHWFIKIVQAYSYSWYGNIIAVESDLCLNSMYYSHWPGSGDKRFMADVLIILSQKPLVFKAKQLMELRLDMFLKIVHTSLSYFFLLRTLDENPKAGT
ncbi:odorant receptor 249 [Nasonia vitripennis]|uniref:Odorant receptor n=1 Tax=Nasonia vitripennis TaxID=7425 RepID=A0A7M6UDF9_NASVI|nr:odorant receptor 249 [Nasonia vitripennis]